MKNSITILCGPPGCGKTLLAHELDGSEIEGLPDKLPQGKDVLITTQSDPVTCIKWAEKHRATHRTTIYLIPVHYIVQ